MWCVALCGTAHAQQGLCARVGVRLEQEAVISRDAFRATFQINNEGDQPITALGVSLDIRDPQGVAANARFGIGNPELAGLNDISGSGIVNVGATGTATWTIVPNDLAAPTEPLIYAFGGTLQYSVGGSTLTIPLTPDRLTVYPNPRLQVKYFWEKYVYSDDPFTTPVEPSQPFSIGLMMSNVGAGLARNVRVTSGEPQITWNDRGLLINFQLIGSQFNDLSVSPSFTGSLGDIPPAQTRVARYLLTSSLQGRFIQYSVRYQHIDPLGGVTSSIVDLVGPHGIVPPGTPTEAFELMHVVRSQENGADTLAEFLANDRHGPDDPNENAADPTFADLPDTVHLSDGTVAPVAASLSPSVSPTGALTASVAASGVSGWTYIAFDDPFNGTLRLTRATRSDGRELDLAYNAWQTDRIFRPAGNTVLYRHRIHLFDKGGSGNYTLSFEPIGGGISEPAQITTQPVGRLVCGGSAASLSVVATGSAPIVYQWKRAGSSLTDGPTGSGSSILGATAANLTISNATPSDTGAYTCLVFNGFGAITSQPGLLLVNSAVPCNAGQFTLRSPCADPSQCEIPIGTSTLLDGQAVTLDGARAAIDGSHSFQSLRLMAGGVITHTAGGTTVAPGQPQVGLNLAIAGDCTIDGSSEQSAASRIDASGRGFAPRAGIGSGQGSGSSNGGGGGYGGAGGGSGGGASGTAFAAGGISYGSPTHPTDLGSGGGGSLGGAGGGAVHLAVGGTLLVNGEIAADGALGFNSAQGYSSGGGSGGSLWLQAAALLGVGSIHADGARSEQVGTDFGGGGGGGRIALYACNQQVPVSLIHALGGVGFQSGQPGTVHTDYGAITISQQPQSGTLARGQTLTLRVTASSGLQATLTYQWRRRVGSGEYVNLVNGQDNGRVSGVNTPTLVIITAVCSDSGEFDCLVGDTCGVIPSDAAVITVHPACPSDSDCNGVVDPADVMTYVNLWFAALAQGSLNADLDRNGIVEPADVGIFVRNWWDTITSGGGGGC